MRLLIALIFLFSGSLSEAQQTDNPSIAQPVEVGDTFPNKTTYFLIDASGSMADKNSEEIVIQLLADIVEISPAAPVSRTYFRAKDGAACWSPVNIGPIAPASESTAEEVVYQNDFTPMGEALKSAILSANERGGRADIFLISDEDPTPGCGVDICTVAEAYLPLPGINVISIQADPQSASRRDRMGCIDAAQHRVQTHLQYPAGQRSTDIVANKVELNAWQAASLSERWYWLAALACAIAGFVCFSIRYGERTAQYHSEIARIQRLRRASDDAFQIEELDQTVGFFEPVEKLAIFRIAWKALFIISTLLTAVLIFFAFCSYLISAQAAAWFVLNSRFANAFAILATTPALFAAGQYWLYDQSKRTYYLVSDSADEERKRKAKARAEQLLSEYEAFRAMLDQIQFRSPWSNRRLRSNRYEPSEVDKSNAKLLQSQMINLAKGDLLTNPFSNQVARETDRLKQVSKSWLGLFSKSSVADFISLLNDSDLLAENKKDKWLSLATAIRSKNNRLISTRLSALFNDD